MLRHVVMVRFRDREKVQAHAIRFRQMLIELLDKIPELLEMEVGLNVSDKTSAFDLLLTSAFRDEEALDAYRVHPEHVRVLDFMKTVVAETAVVDYYV